MILVCMSNSKVTIMFNQFSSVTQSCLTLWTPWTAACQGPLSITNSWSLLKLMSVTLVMPSNHLILCHPLLLPPSIFPRIRVLFQWVSSLHQVAKVLEFQLQRQSFPWIFRTDFHQDWLVGSPCRPRDSQEYSPIPQFKSTNSLAFTLLGVGWTLVLEFQNSGVHYLTYKRDLQLWLK